MEKLLHNLMFFWIQFWSRKKIYSRLCSLWFKRKCTSN